MCSDIQFRVTCAMYFHFPCTLCAILISGILITLMNLLLSLRLNVFMFTLHLFFAYLKKNILCFYCDSKLALIFLYCQLNMETHVVATL